MTRKEKNMKHLTLHLTALLFIPLLFMGKASAQIAQYPLYLSAGVPPVVMLTMGRDHKLYYEAYNDASDLNNDGVLDISYKPDTIDYFGYFDSFKCYNYASNKFTPISINTNKQCSGNWSGDFLNYITTSRIDAMRKVLYGGFRSTDSTTETIITRSFIPQDAHSWGKEYTSIAVDGYDITNYTPLSLPASNTRHLFANVSLSDTGQPLMRVLNDSTHRIWEWVAIERPVAGSKCNDSSGSRVDCNKTGGEQAALIPNSLYSNLVRTTYDISSSSGHPNNHSDFNTWITNYAIPANEDGSGSINNIQGTDNPYGSNDNYLTVINGNLTIPTSGDYKFAVDGDDAVEVLIDGNVVAGWYGGHGACNCTDHSGTVNLSAGLHSIEFRHEERTGGDSFVLKLVTGVVPASTIVDYNVNVDVCIAGMFEDNCKAYSDGTSTSYKPVGILQEYGEDDQMAFGLLTGSFLKNTSGGVLRKNISSFRDEVDLDTGIFTNSSGIIETLDKLRISQFDYSGFDYTSGWITTRAITEGEAKDWGNPIAELMYEGLRYFAGKAGPTSEFSTGTDGGPLSLPVTSWLDPYRTTSGGYAHCAKPIQLVISDVNASYDSDQLPGSYFNSSFTGDLTGMNVSSLADRIWAGESEASNIFIGESGTNTDGTPAPKTVTSFANIRGLAPEEPTKQGSYYAGSVALYGQETDINPVQNDQNVDTLAVALASPLPRIEIPVSGKVVTLVPFAKSVGGSSISATSSFQPTNQIVDFFVETIVNTGTGNQDASVNQGRPYGTFQINYEDVEQAADHDMDAIVEYEFYVDASDQVIISLTSSYAAGGIKQHMGYVISGTTQDGTYLVVRDADTDASSDPDYFLDTPPGQGPSGVWNDNVELPLNSTRTFTVGTTASASFIKNDPLWYAAKWSMADEDANGVLETDEWDSDNNGVPDGYFLVTNAGTLSEQLNKAFKEIVARTSSSAAVASNSTRLNTNTKIYQARFNSLLWTGQLLAFNLDSNADISSQEWDAADEIPAEVSRSIFSYNPAAIGNEAIIFEYANLDPTTQQSYLNTNPSGTIDNLGADRVDFIRGLQTEEQSNSGPFRDRSSLMGDIVNSAPAYVGLTENFGYSSLSGIEGSSYVSYRSSKLSRTPAVYFGSNDGMLHAIHADTGSELFTYVPDNVISKLNLLTHPRYGCTNDSNCLPHEYFVDGSPIISDAYISVGGGSDAWHSVLIGTTGRGGQGIFALDVNSPNTFSTANIMWEISSSQTPNSGDLTELQNNLGYTMAEPNIVKMHNGQWVAIIGNGYDSASKKAVLLILDLETGAIIKSIDTGIGSGALPNGLSSTVPVDEDGDFIVDIIYAGDLQGNLWKFDVTSSNPNSWDVAFKQGSTPKPLYIAKDSNSDTQPITAKPEVGFHPKGGLMVYFGTGKFFEEGDQDVSGSIQTQSFYALRDQGSILTDRSSLQEQSITDEAAITSLSLRVRLTTENEVDYATKDGWYMDLVSPVNGVEGERVTTRAILRGDNIIFVTLVPEEDPCGTGGFSWLMELDAISGKILPNTPFDLNKDGKFDDDDLLKTVDTNNDGNIDSQDYTGISGISYDDAGINSNPTILDKGDGQEVKISSADGATNNLVITGERSSDPIGRQSWRQLR